jgi:hypothetical protein
MDAVEGTVRSGKVDGGGVVILNDSTAAMCYGFNLANAKRFEDSAKELVDLLKEEAPPGVEFEMDAGSYQDLNLHHIRVPVPDPKAAEVFGQSVEITLAFGEDSAYIAAGKGATSLLKKVVDSSAMSSSQQLPASQFTIAATPILKFAQSVEPNPMIDGLIATMGDGKNDKLYISSQYIENGSKTRIEIQEGLLKLGGAAATEAQKFGGGFPGGDF